MTNVQPHQTVNPPPVEFVEVVIDGSLSEDTNGVEEHGIEVPETGALDAIFDQDEDEPLSVPAPLREDDFSVAFAENLTAIQARLRATPGALHDRETSPPPSSAEIESVTFSRAAIVNLPLGTRWSEVHIERIDGHTVSVRVGAVHRRLSYQDMGMASCKNREPVRQWEMLMDLCENRGRLSWPPTDKTRRQVSALRHTLQRLFGIDEDPLEYAWGGYRARFRASDR
ncbi:hypothetical protein LVJ94_17200 [Pendulispora rubella]|uniref:Uncharacterized protein n=1 Tax=Pendulispora rubella TaxID=2741070 RepID=A0ABZ2LDJ0_9BACT